MGNGRERRFMKLANFALKLVRTAQPQQPTVKINRTEGLITVIYDGDQDELALACFRAGQQVSGMIPVLAWAAERPPRE